MDFTKSDLHVHTKLSLCASNDAFAEDYLKAAADNGQEVIGFSDHYWDERVHHPNLIGFYQAQNTEHVLQLKKELETIDHHGLKVLFGCETEFAGHTLGISEEAAKLFDYVFVTALNVINFFYFAFALGGKSGNRLRLVSIGADGQVLTVHFGTADRDETNASRFFDRLMKFFFAQFCPLHS